MSQHNVQAYASENLVVIGWKDTLSEAWGLMSAKNIRHLPVVDDDGFLIGVLSADDLARAAGKPELKLQDAVQFDDRLEVSGFMNWPVESIDSEASLSEAAKQMIEKKVSALFVINSGQVAGILTTHDMLRALLALAEGEKSQLVKLRSALEDLMITSPIGRIVEALSAAGI